MNFINTKLQCVAYTLNHWEPLSRCLESGHVEIDNNLMENAIRPSCIGKKNWMFIGHPKAGWRSAVIYSILESCRRQGVEAYEYLKDVLTRLPDMKITEVAQLTPSNWIAARKSKKKSA